MARLTGNNQAPTTRSLNTVTGFVPAGTTLQIPKNEQLIVGELIVEGNVQFGENSSIYPLKD